MRIALLSSAITAAVVTSLFAPPIADAMPMFARKYKLPCTACHDALAYPRLNNVGYKFRRAGFRMPENIGKDELTDFSMTDHNSMKVDADNTTEVDRKAGMTDSSNTFSGDMELHVMTGSFQKYFASEAELDFAPGSGAAFNNADVRAVYGDQDLWFVARAGVFHPGVDGKGHTTPGKQFNMKDWGDGKTLSKLTDVEIDKMIRDGNVGDDGKERMPAFAKLGDAQIKTLIAYIRTFQK